ncbi:MAG: substrate-binding domain-containing protein, partial [Lachnospiraceae bacterium]|nr:substrate-binding domain-containing protein [Lachnospiraceae bacterium]
PAFLENGATAIMCGNDLIASGVVEECKARGLRVPEDISVIGFDDIPIASAMTPALTTVNQNRLELGKGGYAMLSSLISGIAISKALLRPKLVVRKSTSKARSTK